jgi:flagellar FliJ protein
MAKFVFKLEALLKQRKREEREWQRLLAEQAAIVNSAEEAVRRINAAVESGHDDVRRHLMGKLDMSFLTAHRRFMGAMQRKVMDLVQKVAIAKKRLEEIRIKLTEAAKRRKAIEKLRENQFDRWKMDQAQRETALSDEIGSQIAYHDMMQQAADGEAADEVTADEREADEDANNDGTIEASPINEDELEGAIE